MAETTRPVNITTALDAVAARLGVDTSTALDAYISGLEAARGRTITVTIPAAGTTVSPYWSHQRSVRGEQRRRLRVIKRQTNNW